MKSLKENFPKKHILIIGAGIIGKFNALELSELGFHITIIDPAQHKNSSNAALGLLMGNMYQKRKGRSWALREQSIELWPKWLGFLQKFNNDLKITSTPGTPKNPLATAPPVSPEVATSTVTFSSEF